MAELADNKLVPAVRDAQHAALGASIGTDGPDLDQHFVAVHGIEGCRRSDVDVSADLFAQCRIVGSDESVAVAVHGEASGDEILAGRSGARQGVAVASCFEQAV